jgi:5-methylcytosine-specific restriction protein A
MIYKRCIRCGKRVEAGKTCECYTKYAKQPKGYSKSVGNRAVYHTQRWGKLRAYVMSQHDGLDLYAWYVHDKIVLADTVHHIITVADDKDLSYSASNLIPVSDASHKEIHRAYKMGEDRKSEMQEILREAIRVWEARTGGS